MIYWPGVVMRATIPAQDGNAGSMSAVAEFPDPTPPDRGEMEGTIDRSVYLAFAGQNTALWSRAKVVINGVDYSDAVTGPVSVEEFYDTPVRFAEIELSTEKLALNHPESISIGAQAIEITFQVGPLGDLQEWLAFRGTILTAPNDEPWLCHGKIRAQSNLAELMDVTVCVSLPAHSGYTRGDIIMLAAQEAGIVLVHNPGWSLVSKPFEFTGKFSDLLSIFLEIEGGMAREVFDGSGGSGMSLANLGSQPTLTGPGHEGVTPGVHDYVLGFILDDGTEIFGSRASITVPNVSDAVVRITFTAIQAGVQAVSIYRTKADGTALFVDVASINQNLTPYYDDSYTDAELGDSIGGEPSLVTMEIIPEEELVSSNSVFDFSEDDGVSLLFAGETPPSRPVTEWDMVGVSSNTASGTQVTTMGDPQTGSGSIITRYTDQGVTYRYVREDYARQGAFAFSLLVHKLEVDRVYPVLRSGGGQPTIYSARLNNRTTRELSQVWNSSLPTVTSQSVNTESWTWDVAKCLPVKHESTLVTNTYTDVTTITVRVETEIWTIVTALLTQRVVTTINQHFDGATYVEDSRYTLTDTWSLSVDGTGWTHTGIYTNVSGIEQPTDVSDSGSGPLPVPSVAAGADEAVIEQTAFTLPVVVSGTGYVPFSQKDDKLAPFLESADEARRVAQRRFRKSATADGLSAQYPIEGIILPLIRPGHVVSITNQSRSITSPKYGYITHLKRTIGGAASGGAQSMSGEFIVPPDYLRETA